MPFYIVRVVDYTAEFYNPVDERFNFYPTWEDAMSGAADATVDLTVNVLSGYVMRYHSVVESADINGVVYSELVGLDGKSTHAVLIHPMYRALVRPAVRPPPAHAIMNPEEEDDDEAREEAIIQNLIDIGIYKSREDDYHLRNERRAPQSETGTLIADDRCHDCLFSPSGVYNAPCLRCQPIAFRK